MTLINYREVVDMVYFFIGISVSGSDSGQMTEFLAKIPFGLICRLLPVVYFRSHGFFLE